MDRAHEVANHAMESGTDNSVSLAEFLAERAGARDLHRRAMLRMGVLAGLGALVGAGCSSSRKSASTDLPGPRWPTPNVPMRPQRSYPAPSAPRDASPEPLGDILPRSAWARGQPIPSRMDPMQPVNKITIHHDGMPPVTVRAQADVAARLEQIRQSHLERNFGDIGYHYVVDPVGRVWQGRQLSWQGAHVANQNPGNLGVLCLGNFEQQTPTDAQLSALDRFVGAQASRYGVPGNRIYTHRELAPTICPGRNLQRVIDRVRA